MSVSRAGKLQSDSNLYVSVQGAVVHISSTRVVQGSYTKLLTNAEVLGHVQLHLCITRNS